MSADIIPLFKPADKFSVFNYELISILSTVTEVLEKTVAERMTYNLNSSPFTLHLMQFGFRAKNTETATCFLTENI